jgi:hypothetical protein
MDNPLQQQHTTLHNEELMEDLNWYGLKRSLVEAILVKKTCFIKEEELEVDLEGYVNNIQGYKPIFIQ